MMQTINIYLLRHGKTLTEPSLCGSTDVLVDESHQQQISHAILKSQYDFEQIITSPLKRCRELASQINNQISKQSMSVSECPLLKEMDFGEFDGVPFEQLKPQWPILEKFWQQPATTQLPNAESLHQFYDRVAKGWQEIVSNVTQDSLVICHGGTIRMILAQVLQLDWQNAALFSRLQISHHSITHIKITKAEQNYIQVCAIGAPLSFE